MMKSALTNRGHILGTSGRYDRLMLKPWNIEAHNFDLIKSQGP